MRKTSKTLLVFGMYLIVVGLSLLLIPNTLLGILGLPLTNEVWIRVIGVLALALAYYYISDARVDSRDFAEWSIPARIWVFVAFTGFVVAGFVGPIMIAFGTVDLLGALWTWSALRTEK